MVMLFNNLQGLTDLQRAALISRYVSLVNELRRRSKLYAFVFHSGRMIVTIGSLIVPALLSIQYTNAGPSFPTEMSYQIYWITWAVSLLVTTFNGVLTLFRVEKKYYYLHTTVEQIKSEAFQYIHLSGIYGGHYCKPGIAPSHANQYKYFVHHMEKIKLKQVEEEYYKLIEQAKHQTTTAPVTGTTTAPTDQPPADKVIAGLYTPTPSQTDLTSHQQVLAAAVIKPNIQIGVGLDNASNKASKNILVSTKDEAQTKGRRAPTPTPSLSV